MLFCYILTCSYSDSRAEDFFHYSFSSALTGWTWEYIRREERETFISTHFTLLTSFSFTKAKGKLLRIIRFLCIRVYMWEARRRRKKSPTQVSCHFFCWWSLGVDNSTLCTLWALYILSFRLLTFTFFDEIQNKKKIFSGFSSCCLLQTHSQSCRKNMLLRRKKAHKKAHTYFKASLVLREAAGRNSERMFVSWEAPWSVPRLLRRI